MQDRAIEPIAQIMIFAARCRVDIRHIANINRQDHHPFVQHLIVLDIVEQCRGNARRARCHENRCAGNAGRAVLCRFGKDLDWQSNLCHPLAHKLATMRPSREQRKGDEADHKREPAALGNLGEVGCKISAIDDQEDQHDGRCIPPFPFPNADQQNAHEQRINGDSASHRNTVSAGEVGRVLEGQDQQYNREHQSPIDDGDVNLARFGFRCVTDRKARNIAHLDRLVGDRKGARDYRLAGDKGCDGRKENQRQTPFFARKVKERALDRLHRLCLRQANNHRALAKIIEQQARHDKAEPRQAHRPTAKMPHVGIKRL